MFEKSRENIFGGYTVTNTLMVLNFVIIAGKFLPKRPQIIKKCIRFFLSRHEGIGGGAGE